MLNMSSHFGTEQSEHRDCICGHGSSKATKNESSCPDEIPLQMLPMGIKAPENMKIENI